LKDIDLRIDRGESVALMGANGSGKTTLCRCANGLSHPARGEVTVDGLSTRDAGSILEIRRRVGFFFQDPSLQLVTWSVSDEVAFGPRNLGWPGERIKKAVRETLAAWGLEGIAARHPRGLSGGQTAAVALASVLVMEPSYLIVDEPASLLDDAGRSILLAALGSGKAERGLLWVTQRPEEAVLCDRVVILCDGEIVADGDPREHLTRAPDLRKWGLDATPATLVSHHLRGEGLELDRVHVETGGLIRELEAYGLRSPRRRERRERGPGDALLSVEAASYSYDEGGAGVRDLDFEVRAGEGLGLVGPSGAGKSTAAYLAAGALSPASGAVRHLRSRGRARKVGLCAQFPEEQFCFASVLEEVAGWNGGRGHRDGAVERRASECMELVGLTQQNIVERAPLSLSEGEKKKVALASALASGARTLVLDEPTFGLDGPSRETAIKAVLGHLEDGGGALIVSHSGDFLLRSTAGAVLLEDGRQMGARRWEEEFGLPRSERRIPPGQVADLCSLCGFLPETRIMASIDSVAGRLSERLLKLLEPSVQGSPERPAERP
jgi:energy-coupling factor transport system ATP-binding protein